MAVENWRCCVNFVLVATPYRLLYPPHTSCSSPIQESSSKNNVPILYICQSLSSLQLPLLVLVHRLTPRHAVDPARIPGSKPVADPCDHVSFLRRGKAQTTDWTYHHAYQQ